MMEKEPVKPIEQDGDDVEYNRSSEMKSTSNTLDFSSKKTRIISAIITLGFCLTLLILFLLRDKSPAPELEKETTSAPTCLTSSCSNSPAKILADEVLGYPICPCPSGCEGECTPEERALKWMVEVDNEFYTYDSNEDNVSHDYLKERFLLATFYYSTLGDDKEGPNPWLQTKNHCDWVGVSCANISELYDDKNGEGEGDDVFSNNDEEETELLVDIIQEKTITYDISTNYVRGINLPQHGLSGTIPYTILAKIHHIQELNLFGNRGLTGNPIPASIGLMSNLWSLGLGRGSFQPTSIPAQIGQLHQLAYLDLIELGLSGSIPPEMGQLTSLQSLAMSENQLTGSLPDEIQSWTNLQVLDVNHNELNSVLPVAMGGMSLLQKLDLSYNAFNGTISEVEFRPLSQTLVELDLSSNNLSGTIPTQLGEFEVLRQIDFSHNWFRGPIPNELGNLLLLEELSLEGNTALTGFIPEKVCDLRTINGSEKALTNLSANCRMCPGWVQNGNTLGAKECCNSCEEV